MVKCCWDDLDLDTITFTKYCSTCEDGGTRGKINCSEPVKSGRFIQGDLPQLETVPPNRTLPGDVGDLPTLEQVPPPRTLPGIGGDIPTLEPGPEGLGLNQGTEGEPPLPVVCSEEAGLELDEETGQCVPIESPVTEQPEELEEEPEEEQQQTEEEQQPSEEEGGNDNNDN